MGQLRSFHPGAPRALRIFFSALPFLMIFGAHPACAQTEKPDTKIETEDSQQLILAVQAGPHILSPALIVYQYQDRNYLPVMALAAALDFYAEPDMGRGYIGGWALDEDHTFSIDTQKHEMTVRGARHALPGSAILSAHVSGEFSGAQEIYVQQEILNKLWPLSLTVNLPALTLDVAAEDNLPFMERLARKQRHTALSSSQHPETTVPKNLKTAPNKYRLYGLPAADIESWHRYTSGKGFDGLTTLNGVQDLAWMSANYAASYGYDDGGVVNPDVIRLRLDREATQDEPLPLDLQRIELGDTRIRHSPLIGNGTSGRGAMVTSSDRYYDGEFDRITLDGTGPIGWDAELYRNGELLSFGTVDERGEYRFQDVALNFGNNQLRVVLYGPQGQIREITENYSFGSNMLRPGQFSYTLGAVEAEKDLIRLRDDDRNDRLDGFAVTGSASYGINRHLTAFATLNTIPTDRDHTRRDYATIGASTALPFGSVQAEAYQDISRDDAAKDTGNALDLRFITDLAGFKLNLRNALFRDFESPESGYGTLALDRKTEIGVQRNVALPFGALGLNLDLENQRRRDGSSFSTLSTRQTLGYGGVRLAHRTQTWLNDNHHDSTTGQLTATARMKKWRLRSTLNYDIFPDTEINAFDGELFYRASEKLSASLFARHDMEEKQSSGGFQLNYDFEKFIGSLETLWLENDGAQITLRATTSLGPYGKEGQYIMTSERLGGTSMARARVFMDHDHDGLFSEGDTPVGEARIRVNGHANAAETDEDGILVARAGVGHEDAAITLDQTSLPDPYYKPALDGYKTALRPGSFPTFDFPVIETGAVEGTITYTGGRPVTGIRLDLVNASGETVQTTESAYDGYYSFEYVPPGAYLVRVDPSYKIDIPAHHVIVGADNLFASGIDLHLLEPAAGPTAIIPDTVQPESPAPEIPPPEAAIPESIKPESVTTASVTANPAPPAAPPPALQTLRMGEYMDRLRLVIPLSGPVPYDLTLNNDARSLILSLPAAALSGAWSGTAGAGDDCALHTEPLLSSCTVSSGVGGGADGGVRIVLGFSNPVILTRHIVRAAKDGNGYDLQIDLTPD